MMLGNLADVTLRENDEESPYSIKSNNQIIRSGKSGVSKIGERNEQREMNNRRFVFPTDCISISILYCEQYSGFGKKYHPGMLTQPLQTARQKFKGLEL